MAKSCVELTFKDVANRYAGKPGALAGGCCGCICFIIFVILFGPATVIQLGQKKYGLARNTMSGVVDLDNTFVPGRYWLGFWREFLEFPSTLSTIQFSDETPEEGVQQLSPLRSRDSDGKRILLDVSVQYRLKQESVGLLYSDYSDLYENVYVSALRDALTKAGNDFQIKGVWNDYKGVNNIMKKACDKVLSSRHAECWDLQLWRVRLDRRYEAALVRTQVRKQAQETERSRSMHSLVRAQTQVILAEYRANVTKLEALGESSKFAIEQQAVAVAAANSVKANAAILQEIAAVVMLRNTGMSMNETSLVHYRHLMMLQDRQKAHLIYSTDGAGGIDAQNVQAMRAGGRRMESDTEL